MSESPATVRLSRQTETQVPEAEIPMQIGSVRLVKQVGKGGMGVVWLAHHEILGRDVAVKFVLSAASPPPAAVPLPPSPQAGGSAPAPDGASSASPTTPAAGLPVSGPLPAGEVQAFIEGCRAAAAVRHEGLVEVYHADLVNGIPYLVMEYVDGPSLESVIRRLGALSLPLTLAIMEVACGAIAELHDAGIIHRDIKPANLLLSPEGRIEITDFGLACERPAKGQNAGLAGTPVYMAPEMFEGQISLKSDVYALGITLFEFLTGTVPFEGSPTVVHARHRDDPLPLELLTAHKVPPAVAEVIERATTKNPMLRSRTARHVLQALKQAVRDESVWSQGRRELAQLTSRWRSAPDDGDASAAPSTATYYEHISMRAERKRYATPAPEPISDEPALAPAPTAPPPPDQIADHISCAGCETDLFSADKSGACPTCGQPVAASLAPDRLCFADRRWLDRLRIGLGKLLLGILLVAPAWLIAGGTLYAVLVSAGVVARADLWTQSGGVPWALACWLLVLRSLLAASIFHAMPAEPAPSLAQGEFYAPPALRTAARALAVAAVLAGECADLFRLFRSSPDAAPTTPAALPASAYLAGLSDGLQIALAFASLAVVCWWLSRLVARVPKPSLAAEVWWIVPTSSLAATASIFWGAFAAPRAWNAWLVLAAVAVGILALLALGFAIAYVWRVRTLVIYQLDPTQRPKPSPESESE